MKDKIELREKLEVAALISALVTIVVSIFISKLAAFPLRITALLAVLSFSFTFIILLIVYKFLSMLDRGED
jgi:hypothetical protein